jgi:hypothetical protein
VYLSSYHHAVAIEKRRGVYPFLYHHCRKGREKGVAPLCAVAVKKREQRVIPPCTVAIKEREETSLNCCHQNKKKRGQGYLIASLSKERGTRGGDEMLLISRVVISKKKK